MVCSTLNTLCPPEIRELMAAFARGGQAAYLVGGCVRDALMGRTPHDWDMAVTTRPEETQALCQAAGYRSLPTGITHGTITVLVPGHATGTQPTVQKAAMAGTRPPLWQVECTSCRTENGYSDGRHPDSVNFTGSIRDDLARRDFTVNAMAAVLLPDGSFDIIDIFGGADDLARGIIRCVGDATTRLTEDALRILRAVRFITKLQFTPDDALIAAIPAVAPGLHRVSRERICAEFTQILCSSEPVRGMQLLWDLGLWKYVLPAGFEKAPHVKGTSAMPDVGNLAALPPEISLRLACLLWDECEVAVRENLQSLRLSNDTVRRVMACLSIRALRDMPICNASVRDASETARRLRHQLGEMACPALSVQAARGADTSALVELVQASEAQGDCVTLACLAVTGRDLADIGVPAGRETGRMLQLLLDLVLTDPSKNTFEQLIKEVQSRV